MPKNACMNFIYKNIYRTNVFWEKICTFNFDANGDLEGANTPI